MRAVRVARTGGPEVMELASLPTPAPAAGQALVRVQAAGVNFMDVYQRTGSYPREVPFVLGEEGAGVIEAVGAGVQSLRVGDSVAWVNGPGSYASHVLVRADRLVPIPSGLSAVDAAAAMLQGMTAHYLARDTYPLARGSTCLVHAVAGGVGLLLVQLAKAAGARVLGTTSTEEKASIARQAGADDVILYTTNVAFDEAVRAATSDRGVDVVYDSVGATTFDRSLLSLRPRGMLVLFGQSSGRVPPFDLQILNARGSLFVTRPTLRDYVATPAELASRAHAVLDAVARGALRLRVNAPFPLERAADAHRALESRGTSGKLVLVP